MPGGGGGGIDLNKIFFATKPHVPCLDLWLFGSEVVGQISFRSLANSVVAILECALHASEKAEQQEMRTKAFLALVGFGFGG